MWRDLIHQLMIEYDNVVTLPKEEARMENVDEYIELLYEDSTEEKVKVQLHCFVRFFCMLHLNFKLADTVHSQPFHLSAHTNVRFAHLFLTLRAQQ